MFADLTSKESEILFFLKSFTESNGYPPTVREICSGVNLKSTSSVHGYIERLVAKGYIIKDGSKTRTYVLADGNSDDLVLAKKKTIDIPIVGKVTAGAPILAVENIEDTFPLPMEIVKDRELFMLEVSGDSMINRGIYDGDFVLIERMAGAKNGDIVLALIDDEATIKTFYKEKTRFRLQPENDSMSPIYTDHLEILGHVVGLYRNLL
ncbi:MAG: transcriptional repressor LexA [Tissierellia bacterium]|nr:transcriptional repressor LexA [Tissierellia bacterium]